MVSYYLRSPEPRKPVACATQDAFKQSSPPAAETTGGGATAAYATKQSCMQAEQRWPERWPWRASRRRALAGGATHCAPGSQARPPVPCCLAAAAGLYTPPSGQSGPGAGSRPWLCAMVLPHVAGVGRDLGRLWRILERSPPGWRAEGHGGAALVTVGSWAPPGSTAHPGPQRRTGVEPQVSTAPQPATRGDRTGRLPLPVPVRRQGTPWLPAMLLAGQGGLPTLELRRAR